MKYFLVILLLLGQLISSANNSDLDSHLSELQKLSELPTTLNYANLIRQIADIYFAKENFQKAQTYYFECYNVSKQSGYDSLTFYSLLSLGNALFWQSKYDSSLFFLNEAVDFNQTYPISPTDSIRLFRTFGNTYYYMGSLNKAYQYRTAIMDISICKNNPKYEADNLYDIAELEMGQGKMDEAILKLNQALEIYSEKERWDDALFCYDMLSTIYFKQKKYEKALEYINLACEIEPEKNPSYHQGSCAYKLARVHIKLNNYPSAMFYLEKAMDIRKNSNQWEDYTRSQLLMAELRMLMGDCRDANVLLQESLDRANQLKIKPLRRSVYKKMSKVYSVCGKYKMAFDYQKKYFQLRDSLSDVKVKKEIANLSSIHELEQSQQQLALLRKEKEHSKFYYSTIAIACLVLLGLVGFGIWLLKKQYQYNAKLKEHKNKIEDQNQILFETNDKLKSANNELESFAYIASHDLKAPLRTVGNYAALIDRRYRKVFDKNGVEFLNLIIESVEHMSQLLDDVLSFSNVKKNNVSFEPVELNALLGKVLQTIDANVKEKDAKIYHDDLPSVMGNSMQLFQVFQNLISNAIKFMPEDRQPEIHIQTERKEDMIRFAIQDNGIGIEEQYQDRIFTIFKRLHTQQEFKGTGIGLSICKKIIEKHQGEIWVESDGRFGTTFFFTLPFAEIVDKNSEKELVDADGDYPNTQGEKKPSQIFQNEN